MDNFFNLQVSEEIKKAIEKFGFEKMTPIQAIAIPKAMNGQDLIAQSQTGTGKTLAFAIPLVYKILQNNKHGVQALILCPTRELAVQVDREIKKLIEFTNLNSVVVYGGEYIGKQLKELKKHNQIVVGTPGRLLDHIRRRTVVLKNVQTVVLDEADEMLDMGFIDDIDEILSHIDGTHQTMLFSATVPPEIVSLSKNHMNDPEVIRISPKEITVDKIEQSFIRVKNDDKLEVLSRIVDLENSRKTIVFCNTKKTADELYLRMKDKGYRAEPLHGDLTQQKREQVLKEFRNGKIGILIATDVAARGLDIKDVDLVINYDIPQEEELYVHRIGRTGRAGSYGKTYSFAYGRDLERLKRIEKYAKCKITEKEIPRYEQVRDKTIEHYIESVMNENSEEIPSFYYDIVNKIKEHGIDPETFLALTLQRELKLQRKEKIDYRSYERDRLKRKKNSDRPERKRRKGRERDMVRFFVDAGYKDHITAGEIVRTVASKCRITGDKIGAIEISNNRTFFDVAQDASEKVMKNSKYCIIKGKKIMPEKN